MGRNGSKRPVLSGEDGRKVRSSHPWELADLPASWRLSEGLRLGLEVGPTQFGLGLELADTWYISLHPGWGLSLLEPGIAAHYLFRF